VLQEAFRVLKPGGCFAVSDVVVRGEVPVAIRKSMELWVGCTAGALSESGYRNKLAAAGFTAVDGAGLAGLFDASHVVEAVGVYKPHSKLYQLALDRLALPARAIALQSSNAWDAYAASAFGMRVAWCNRYQQRPERLPGGSKRCSVQSYAEDLSLTIPIAFMT